MDLLLKGHELFNVLILVQDITAGSDQGKKSNFGINVWWVQTKNPTHSSFAKSSSEHRLLPQGVESIIFFYVSCQLSRVVIVLLLPSTVISHWEYSDYLKKMILIQIPCSTCLLSRDGTVTYQPERMAVKAPGWGQGDSGLCQGFHSSYYIVRKLKSPWVRFTW